MFDWYTTKPLRNCVVSHRRHRIDGDRSVITLVGRKLAHYGASAIRHTLPNATNGATTLEIDAVTDPADTRQWIFRGLRSGRPRHAPRHHFVDAW